MALMSLPMSLLVALSLAGGAPDEKEFLKDLDRVHRSMERGKWSSAYKAIGKLLEEHEGQAYVHARILEIQEDTQRCVFHMEHEAPDPEDLISGELVSYNEKTGDIKLRYGPDQMGDFEGSEVQVHPAMFDGPYQIVVKGERYPRMTASYDGKAESPTIVVGADGRDAYLTAFGFKSITTGSQVQWLPARLIETIGGRSNVVEEKETSPAAPGKRFELKVAVTKGAIAAYYNKRKFMGARKRTDGWGRAGLMNLPGFDQIEINGKVQPAWIQGLVDAAMAKHRERFERTYRVEDHLPQWLLAGTAAPTGPEEVARLPGEPVDGQEAFADKALSLIDGLKLDLAEDFITDLQDDEVSPAVRAFLMMRLQLEREDMAAALESCETVVLEDPAHGPSRAAHAHLIQQVLPPGLARERLTSIAESGPPHPETYLALATVLLRVGRPDLARDTLAEALESGIHPGRVESLNKTLTKAEKGPAFLDRFEHQSDHYIVVSDIDKKVCVEAANLLERSYRAYGLRLVRIKDLEKRKFPVYLFAGEAGYKDYIEDVIGPAPENTAGLYSPVLKQLLIWNLPDRDAMYRTVRHEGFHQYLDRLMDNPPRWFNEGHAEYYELAGLHRGEWEEGQLNPLHLRTLRTKDCPSLRELLSASPGQFYGAADVHYASAWAFVHFLRTERDQAELLGRFFEAYRAEADPKVATESVLDGVDLDALEEAFKNYVTGLR